MKKEGTLSLSRRTQISSASNPKPKQKKPKAWSHQDELKSAIGKKIVVTFDGSTHSGVLNEADQFTLKIDKKVFFKSAIVCFEVLQ